MSKKYQSNNPVRFLDANASNQHDLGVLGFSRVEAAVAGHPSYHPEDLLKLDLYRYINRDENAAPRPGQVNLMACKTLAVRCVLLDKH